MTAIDAIVVSYNARAVLRDALASLFASEVPLNCVFVVDNASSDGSAAMVREEFPAAELIALDENVGFARGNNLAFAASDAPYLLLLNPDAAIAPGGLGVMLEELESADDIGIVGPVLVSPDGRVQFEGGRRDPSIAGEFGNISRLNQRWTAGMFGRYLMSDWDHRDTRDVEVLSGACMLIRREALDGHLFSEEFFMYGEDVELCQRLRDAGWRMRYCAATEVLHHGGASSKRARTRMRVAGVVSMTQLLAKRRGALYALGYLAIVPIAWPLGILVRRLPK